MNKETKIYLLLFMVGCILWGTQIYFRYTLTKNYKQYANGGHINKDLYSIHVEEYNYAEGTRGKTDDYLVWMMRSKEFRSAKKYEKENMISSWADDYVDRKIGQWCSMFLVLPLFLISLVGLLGSILDGSILDHD